MSRTTRLFVWTMIAATALVAIGALAWRADDFANFAALTDGERRKLTAYAFALLFMPAWLALGSFGVAWMMAKSAQLLADDTRGVAEKSLMASAIFCAGVQVWIASAAVLGEPPGREFGGRLIEAIAGILFIVTANFVAKTSPPADWPDPGRWTRATLRTGWVGVAAGVFILISAIAAPMAWVVWIVAGSTLVYGAVGVLNHLSARRRPAQNKSIGSTP